MLSALRCETEIENVPPGEARLCLGRVITAPADITAALRSLHIECAAVAVDVPGERLAVEAYILAVGYTTGRIALAPRDCSADASWLAAVPRMRVRARIHSLQAVFDCEQISPLRWPGRGAISVRHPQSMLLVAPRAERAPH